MKIKEFRNISIRGRVAYSINCLENALQFYEINEEGWSVLLKKLWDITELQPEIIDFWLGSVNECLPEYYSETYNYEELYGDNLHLKNGELVCLNEPLISKEDFNILKKAYMHSNATIDVIIKLIFQIGTMEMNVGFCDYSLDTLEVLQDILDIMEKNKISMPPTSDYIQFAYDPKLQRNDYGWGKPFDGKQLSIILK